MNSLLSYPQPSSALEQSSEALAAELYAKSDVGSEGDSGLGI